jgi:hypothetical protein
MVSAVNAQCPFLWKECFLEVAERLGVAGVQPLQATCGLCAEWAGHATLGAIFVCQEGWGMDFKAFFASFRRRRLCTEVLPASVAHVFRRHEAKAAFRFAGSDAWMYCRHRLRTQWLVQVLPARWSCDGGRDGGREMVAQMVPADTLAAAMVAEMLEDEMVAEMVAAMVAAEMVAEMVPAAALAAEMVPAAASAMEASTSSRRRPPAAAAAGGRRRRRSYQLLLLLPGFPSPILPVHAVCRDRPHILIPYLERFKHHLGPHTVDSQLAKCNAIYDI